MSQRISIQRARELRDKALTGTLTEAEAAEHKRCTNALRKALRTGDYSRFQLP